MIICKNKNIDKNKFLLKLNGIRLERCVTYKYLGVYIDEDLNWKPHVQYTCKEKNGRVSGSLARLRYCTSQTTIS